MQRREYSSVFFCFMLLYNNIDLLTYQYLEIFLP